MSWLFILMVLSVEPDAKKRKTSTSTGGSEKKGDKHRRESESRGKGRTADKPSKGDALRGGRGRKDKGGNIAAEPSAVEEPTGEMSTDVNTHSEAAQSQQPMVHGQNISVKLESGDVFHQGGISQVQQQFSAAAAAVVGFPAFQSQFVSQGTTAVQQQPFFDPSTVYQASLGQMNAGTAFVQQQALDPVQNLLQRYPVVWQGFLALKDHQIAVQMHHLAGNRLMADMCLPHAPIAMPTVVPQLKIGQRMKLEPAQLDVMTKRMQVSWPTPVAVKSSFSGSLLGVQIEVTKKCTKAIAT